MAPRLALVAQNLPFLDVIATRWIAQASASGGADDPLALARGIILLPTRRAARALSEAFLRVADGRVMLLPRISAIGALDEAPLALGGWLDLAPAIEPMRRLALLSGLVLKAGRQFGTAPTLDQAWPLAQALADLMDEAERAECDLARTLPDAAEGFAQHWQDTLRFLQIVTAAWPQWLAENGLGNPAARQMALLRAQSEAWAQDHAAPPIWAAGFTTANPAVAALLRAIGGMPHGQVVLAGVDEQLADADWETLPDSHPQAGFARLLDRIGARRGDLQHWDGAAEMVTCSTGRVRMLSRALLPEQALGDWLDDRGASSQHDRGASDQNDRGASGQNDRGASDQNDRGASSQHDRGASDQHDRGALDQHDRSSPSDIDGISRLHTADQQEEAAAIALVLRAALEVPGRRAALVTPDRALANRVGVELSRWGVAVDDSAGEPLVSTPPAMLLRLLAEAVSEGLAPVALLSLLKHPLAAAGAAPAECRRQARALELLCLRGPAPTPGVDGLRDAARQAAEDPRAPRPLADVPAFLDRVFRCLSPLLLVSSLPAAEPGQLLRALLQAAEALATTDQEPGAAILWAGEEGNALALHLSELGDALDGLPEQTPGTLAGLLEASLAGIAVRSRRVLRGLPEGAAEHPRLFIWGLLEARLQTVELMVLGGLTETVWPPAVDPGPWMSRPMRARVGLPAPEEAVGQAAHDFLSACCAAPEIVLSCPSRREGAPAVPARWLVRLDAFLAGRGLVLPAHPASSWLRRLDQPEGAAVPVRPPSPMPPVALRPRRLSVTEIETWMRDPYAVHAKHVLRLRPLGALEEPADAADYGTIVHDGLAKFLDAHPGRWPADAAVGLAHAFDAELDDQGLRPALAAWWRPRLARIAGWVARTEAERRAIAAPAELRTEIAGRSTIEGLPGGPFTLSGRADRIEKRADGTLALFDYKTGTLPSDRSVQAGWSSQLVLEAAMALHGAFGPELQAQASEIVYWKLSGGATPGEERRPLEGDALQALVERSWHALAALVAAYDQPDQPYLSHPRPDWAPAYPDYAQLARVAEWSAAREDGA